MGWDWSQIFTAQFSTSTTIVFTLIFHPPLVMFGQRRGHSEREWMKTWIYTPAWSSSHSLNICFHFGVCFQLCAREYGAPKCGEGCFQVVIWHTPLLFFFFALILILVGKLSLVINHAFSPEERCTSAKNYVFLAVNPGSLVFHLRIDIRLSLSWLLFNYESWKFPSERRGFSPVPTCIGVNVLHI